MIKVRFICALLVAAAHYLLKEVGNAKLAIRAAFNKPEVPHELTAKRLYACQKCPLFYAPLRTCGSPMMAKTWLNPNDPMGCFCQMEVKATTLCNCWLADQTRGEQGWPDELNSYPHGKQPVKD